MLRSIEVRRPDFDFSEVPRDWCDGDAGMTHVINGLSAVFPDGERFFMRAVAAFEDRVDDDEQRARIRGFYGQEAAHGRAHRATFAMLERQGYEIESWLEWYRSHAYGKGVEALATPAVRLATTVALEHFTATLAEIAFDPDDVVERMHPAMTQLLRWHAAEEIEHKAVAFEVLQAVDPRWRIRLVGFVIGVAVLVFYASSAASHLARQDGTRWGRARLVFELVRRPRVVRHALRFLAPRFHPDDHDNYGLAERFLAEFRPLA